MATVASIDQPDMTVAEFLVWDDDAPGVKYELVDGQLRAMAPASITHGTIQSNIARRLGNHLEGSPCRAVTEAGMVPSLKSGMNVRIPDVTVTCEPPDRTEKLVRQPKLIVQIISPSNERDTWESIWACATISSVQEIVVVHSERVEATVFSKDDNGHWPENGLTASVGSTLNLTSIEAALPIAEIYDKTGLIEPEADPS
ncbi:MAG: Uma2 family endonuclease [Pseudomonadota bacterium]